MYSKNYIIYNQYLCSCVGGGPGGDRRSGGSSGNQRFNGHSPTRSSSHDEDSNSGYRKYSNDKEERRENIGYSESSDQSTNNTTNLLINMLNNHFKTHTNSNSSNQNGEGDLNTSNLVSLLQLPPNKLSELTSSLQKNLLNGVCTFFFFFDYYWLLYYLIWLFGEF